MHRSTKGQRLTRALLRTEEAIRRPIDSALSQCFPGSVFEDLREHLSDEWESAAPIRGFLTRLGYEAGGGRFRDIIDVAAAVELTQLATILIDDVIDRSHIRTGISAYAQFGQSITILAAETLKSRATTLLINLNPA